MPSPKPSSKISLKHIRRLSVVGAVTFGLVSIYTQAKVTTLCQVMGLGRTVVPTVFSSAEDFKYIPDTVNCEDLHYYEPGGVIFTACEDTVDTRLKWFPPLTVFDDPVLAQKSQGSLHIIDPKTFTSTRLTMENFDGPFITHGIDVITDPKDKSSVYIFAVNHAPHPDYVASIALGHGSVSTHKARSVIEVFHHRLGTTKSRHIRTIYHPDIRTPNDVFAHSPTSIYVTNDHRYREGLWRAVEDVHLGTTWTDTVHIAIPDPGLPSPDDHSGVRVTKALSKIHNNNGLGHGRHADEILVADCILGRALIGTVSNGEITVEDVISQPVVIDNPSYFRDPYGEKSAFLFPGLAKGAELMAQQQSYDHKMSSTVRMAIPKQNATEADRRVGKGWELSTLFEDDGSRLSTVSASVLVPVAPVNGKPREAWLFASGFMSRSAIAVRVLL